MPAFFLTHIDASGFFDAMTKPLKQTQGDKRCVSFTVAMATDTTPEEFERFVAEMPGHNRKSEPPYEDIHVYSYLLSKGFLAGLGFVKPDNVGGVISMRYEVKNNPAYLVVQGPACEHAVFWDGHMIYDPSPDTPNGKDPSEYQINLWVPIYKLT